jgi:hypothetical protein
MFENSFQIHKSKVWNSQVEIPKGPLKKRGVSLVSHRLFTSSNLLAAKRNTAIIPPIQGTNETGVIEVQ